MTDICQTHFASVLLVPAIFLWGQRSASGSQCFFFWAPSSPLPLVCDSRQRLHACHKNRGDTRGNTQGLAHAHVAPNEISGPAGAWLESPGPPLAGAVSSTRGPMMHEQRVVAVASPCRRAITIGQRRPYRRGGRQARLTDDAAATTPTRGARKKDNIFAIESGRGRHRGRGACGWWWW